MIAQILQCARNLNVPSHGTLTRTRNSCCTLTYQDLSGEPDVVDMAFFCLSNGFTPLKMNSRARYAALALCLHLSIHSHRCCYYIDCKILINQQTISIKHHDALAHHIRLLIISHRSERYAAVTKHFVKHDHIQWHATRDSRHRHQQLLDI